MRTLALALTFLLTGCQWVDVRLDSHETTGPKMSPTGPTYAPTTAPTLNVGTPKEERDSDDSPAKQ